MMILKQTGLNGSYGTRNISKSGEYDRKKVIFLLIEVSEMMEDERKGLHLSP